MLPLSKWKRPIHDHVWKLMASPHDVIILDEFNELQVTFYGPKGTPYSMGVWDVRVDLPEQYPRQSPAVRFLNKIYHPNIDLASGDVCESAVKQEWKSSSDLLDLFGRLLPRLLARPDPAFPLNPEAAILWRRPQEYEEKVREYAKFVTPENPSEQGNVSSGSDSIASSLSDEDSGTTTPSCS